MAFDGTQLDHHHRRFGGVDLGDFIEVVTKKECKVGESLSSEEVEKLPMYGGYAVCITPETLVLSNRSPFFSVRGDNEGQPKIEEKLTEISYGDIYSVQNAYKRIATASQRPS